MIRELTAEELDVVSGGISGEEFLGVVLEAAHGGSAFATGFAYTVAGLGAFAFGYGVGTAIYHTYTDWYYQ